MDWEIQEMQNKDVIIIGAGIAGLLCAERLQKAGIEVTVLEKENSVGGRMATRRSNNGNWDTAAQFFTVRDLRFQMYVDDWLESGVCKRWFVAEGNELGAQGYVRYRGSDGMISAPERLAALLDVQLQTPVTKTTFDGKTWGIWVRGKQAYTCKTLILTAPLPLSLELLEAGQADLDISLHDELKGLRYVPGIAMLARLQSGSSLNEHGGLRVGKEPIKWIADNQLKGISSEVPTLTIHATAGFSQMHWDTEDSIIASHLTVAAQPFIQSEVAEWEILRWKYAFPSNSWHDLFVADHDRNLYLAGDAFGGPRIEGAALSGIQTADEYLDRLGS